MFNNKINHGMRKPTRLPEIPRFSFHWENSKQSNHRTFLVAESNMIQSKQVFTLDETFLSSKKSLYGALSSGTPNQDTFHRAIGSVLTLGQVFGLMPLIGVLDEDASYLRFKWICGRMLYSMVIIFGGCTFCLLCFVRIFTFGLDINNVGMAVFYSSTFLTQILFLRLASNWPSLGTAIEEQETMQRYPLQKKSRTLRLKFKVFCFFVLFLAFVEHVLSIAAGVIKVWGCEKNKSIIEGFYTSSFPQFFTLTTYSHWKAFILQILNLIATFNWNFIDLFIMLVSLGLAERFEHLNFCLDASIGKILPEYFWYITRNEYAHLSQLVRQVDTAINEIVLLSFANNLYTICLQLFNSLNSVKDEDELPCEKLVDGGYITALYFLFSFSFLMSRFLGVSLSAARIHTSARRPLLALFCAPSESYCIEIQRFIDHVTSDMVALTGLNFFYITRGLILTIAGTVVTYELVLVQFNSPLPSVNANITINETCRLPIMTSTSHAPT